MTSKQVNDRNIEQSYINDPNQLFKILEHQDNVVQKAHIVFIKYDFPQIEQVINKINRKGLLVITENENVIYKGSMINFVKTDEKIRFDINLDNLEQEEIKIRSSLVRLARFVIRSKED